jgi:hypothetical protein
MDDTRNDPLRMHEVAGGVELKTALSRKASVRASS